MYIFLLPVLTQLIPQVADQTALWAACLEGYEEIVELLTDAGAAVDVQDEV